MKEGEILGVHGCEGEFGVGPQGRVLLHGGGVPLGSTCVCVGFSGRVPFSTIFISLKTTTKPQNETVSKPLGLISEVPSSCNILKSMKVSKSGLSGLCS